jgi:hypothetical protein
MNVTRSAVRKVRGERAPFPSLAELHRKFLWAKDRFDKEKKTWRAKHGSEVDCEKVAQDMYNVAVSTHDLRAA